MRDIRHRLSSLILLLSIVVHCTHGAPVSSLVSSELEDDSDSPYDVNGYDSAYTFADFDTSHDHDFEPPGPLSDAACSAESPCRLSSSDLAIRSPGEVTIHRRKKAASSKSTSQKHDVTKEPGGTIGEAGKIVGKVGSIISKVGNAIPGPIGTALKVIGTFLSILGDIFRGLSAAARKSAQERGDFTQKVAEQTASKHPGWMVVTLYSKWKPQTYFPGQKDVDWSFSSTETHTGLGTFHYNVFAARGGLFYYDGDRGYENWAWQAPAHLLQPVPDDASDAQKRIVVVNTDFPAKPKPASGQCYLHVDVFEKAGPHGVALIAAGLQDNAHNVVGYGSGVLPYTLHSSQLSTQITFQDKKKGKRHVHAGHALDISMGKLSIECHVGGIDHGQTQMDCQFPCSFK